MLEKVTEKLAEVADALKAKFNDETSETSEAVTQEETQEEVTTEFAEATLADGTTISYEGDLAEGTAVFVVTEEGEQIPAPEGTHALGGDMEGVSIVVNAEGVITEVIDERAEMSEDSEETQEAMSSEDVEKLIDSKIESLATSMETIANSLQSLVGVNEDFKAELEKFNKDIEALKDSPSEQKENKKKFSRNDGLNNFQRILVNKRKEK